MPAYKAGTIKNTACVETPTVPGGNPDDCDDAKVKVEPPAEEPKPEPEPTPQPEPEPEPEPEVPDELPTTGVAYVLNGVLGVGALTATGYYYISSRRNM